LQQKGRYFTGTIRDYDLLVLRGEILFGQVIVADIPGILIPQLIILFIMLTTG
jgi:hypothetical protein